MVKYLPFSTRPLSTSTSSLGDMGLFSILSVLAVQCLGPALWLVLRPGSSYTDHSMLSFEPYHPHAKSSAFYHLSIGLPLRQKSPNLIGTTTKHSTTKPTQNFTPHLALCKEINLLSPHFYTVLEFGISFTGN